MKMKNKNWMFLLALCIIEVTGKPSCPDVLTFRV